jgi:hypothetical protein
VRWRQGGAAGGACWGCRGWLRAQQGKKGAGGRQILHHSASQGDLPPALAHTTAGMHAQPVGPATGTMSAATRPQGRAAAAAAPLALPLPLHLTGSRGAAIRAALLHARAASGCRVPAGRVPPAQVPSASARSAPSPAAAAAGSTPAAAPAVGAGGALPCIAPPDAMSAVGSTAGAAAAARCHGPSQLVQRPPAASCRTSWPHTARP